MNLPSVKPHYKDRKITENKKHLRKAILLRTYILLLVNELAWTHCSLRNGLGL